MVKEINKHGNKYFQCESCNFIYKTKELANKCGEWCTKNHSCNIEIIKHAIKV